MISGKNIVKGKLLLVSANRHADPYPVYPLGVSCLNSYLSVQYPDLEIKVYDMMIGSYQEYASLLHDFNPDFTGISLRNIDDVNFFRKESFIEHYKKIIALTREHCSSVVIIGGAGYSIYPELLFELLEPDFGIYGEGEYSLAQLLSDITTGVAPYSVEGLIYRKNGNVIINERKNYFREPSIEFDPAMACYYWEHSGMLNIQTKRGCPYNCIYCTYPVIEGRKVRTLDPSLIVKNISALYNRGIDYVFFTDSIFNISNDFNMELADMIIASKMKIRWGGYFNFLNLGKELLAKLKQSGLSHIEFGTESLSDEVLKKYGKPFSVNDIFKACDLCNELEIDFAHFLILGGYGETDSTLDETFNNSRKISNTVFFPFVGMRIYPGTALHEIAIKEEVIEKNDPLLAPVYYISKDINTASLQERAIKTGKRWIFPDNDMSEIMARMRKRNKKGPLWEYLKQ